MFAVFLPPLAYVYSRTESPPEWVIPEVAHPVNATIIAFENPIARYSTNRRMYVVARADDGTLGRREVTAGQVSGCHLGDRIPAFEKGPRLYLRPAPCPAD